MANNVLQKWHSSPQPSRFAVVSNYFDVRSTGGTSVIDGILLDPITVNIAFNVYYSNDGTATEQTSTKEWEEKLWTRVPRVFIATQRQEYVFPEPIRASFIKIEYTNLQPKSYTPGNFEQTVVYKKFPVWVVDYFLEQATFPNFIANTVAIVNDALNLAYNYYLDDLNQRPALPVSFPASEEELIKKYFKKAPALNEVDSETLSKINLNLKPYTNQPSALANPESLLGKKVIFDRTLENYPVEQTIPQITSNLLNVSSIDRENIVIEESMPVLYFYLTCRHAYKELIAKFEHHRAYFAAVNEILFLRYSYGSTYDGELYIENGGDFENAELNDFEITNEGTWRV